MTGQMGFPCEGLLASITFEWLGVVGVKNMMLGQVGPGHRSQLFTKDQEKPKEREKARLTKIPQPKKGSPSVKNKRVYYSLKSLLIYIREWNRKAQRENNEKKHTVLISLL